MTTYDKIYKELLEVVPNGSTIMKVMDVLETNGVVTGGLTEDIEWIFNFLNGGWNTVRATSLKEAKLKVKEQYHNMVPNYDSVRPSARADYESHMRDFD